MKSWENGYFNKDNLQSLIGKIMILHGIFMGFDRVYVMGFNGTLMMNPWVLMEFLKPLGDSWDMKPMGFQRFVLYFHVKSTFSGTYRF